MSEIPEHAKEKLAVALLCTFLGGWIAISILIQVCQVHHYGYGGGIDNRGHLPASVSARYGAGPSVTKEELMKATNR